MRLVPDASGDLAVLGTLVWTAEREHWRRRYGSRSVDVSGGLSVTGESQSHMVLRVRGKRFTPWLLTEPCAERHEQFFRRDY
jgi:hypothetical protein